MNDEFMNDPALAPFIKYAPEYADTNSNADNSKAKKSQDLGKGSNKMPADARLPEKNTDFYLATFNDVTSEISGDKEFKSDFKKLMDMLTRIYKLDNHKAVDRKGKSTKKETIIASICLLYLGDSTFNTVILGGNINEYAYYFFPRNRIGVLMTGVQHVDYKDGVDERKAQVGSDYRLFIQALMKFSKKYLDQFK